MKIKPRIIFSSLHIKYFLCYEEIEFDFLKHSGLNLITGINNDIPEVKNGSGKSSFLAALYYAIYGKTPKSVKNINLCHRQFTDKTAYLKLTFFVDDIKYDVISTLEKKSGKCTLLINDENKTKSSVKETRDYIINEILRIPANTFLRTILLSEACSDNFFDLSKYEKRMVKEELFDLAIFGDMYNIIHKDTLSVSSEIKSNQEKINLLEQNIEQLKQSKANYTKQSTHEKNEIKQSIKKIAKDLIELLHCENLESFVKKKKILKDKAIDLHTEIGDKNLMIRKKSLVIERSMAKIESLESQYVKYEKLSDRVCDDCKIILNKDFNVEADKESVIALKGSVSKMSEENSVIESAVEILQDHINKIQHVMDKINPLEQELKLHQRNLKHITETAKTPFNDLLKKSKKDHARTISTVEQQMIDKIYLNCLEDITSENGIKRFIIKDAIDMLNERLKYYLGKLGADYICQCDADLSFTFITSSGETEYNSFSSGETSRINIATLFAFKDVLSIQTTAITNLFFIDEFFDSALDPFSINALLDLLKEELGERDETIYIISHRPEILENADKGNYFSNVILFEKTDGISKITKDAQGCI